MWEHQQIGHDLAIEHKRYGLLTDMGTGKSCIVINVLNTILKLKNHCRALIVCPKSVISVWPLQFEIHSEEDFRLVPLTQSSVTLKNKYLSNNFDPLLKTLVAIINYESVWRDGIARTIKQIPWDCIILDESHRISAPGSKVSWFMKDLKAEYKLLLTGTPMATPLSIYGQYRFLDKSIFGSSFNAFKMRYAVEVNCGTFNKIVGYKNQDELNQKIYSIAYRVMLKDVMELPEETHIDRVCELSPKIRKLYDQFQDDLVAEYNNGLITAQNGLIKILRLAQIVGGYLELEKGGQAIDSPKTEVLMDIIEDLPIDEPVVVFFRFTHELIQASKLIRASGRTVGLMSGQTNDLKEWQDGNLNTLCIQLQKGGVGIDLTRSHYCIYYSKGYNPLDYQQSLARTLRPGQVNKVVYYHIIVKNTIDEIISKTLLSKERDVMYILSQL
jgi:SNF2 family DNA or RNA helicase